MLKDLVAERELGCFGQDLLETMAMGAFTVQRCCFFDGEHTSSMMAPNHQFVFLVISFYEFL